jgi:thiosulfate/3-mercaptopyruvate sulfurtransferase
VLDGGFAKWTAEGRPTSNRDEPCEPAQFDAAVRPAMVIGVDEVTAHAREPGWRIVDSRAPQRYSGEVEPIDPVGGHIPGASNYFFQGNLDEHGIFRTPEDLRTRLAPFTKGIKPGKVVFYCGSGVQACHNLLALEHAGISGARLYPGSWSEWVSDKSRPVETGDQSG